MKQGRNNLRTNIIFAMFNPSAYNIKVNKMNLKEMKFLKNNQRIKIMPLSILFLSFFLGLNTNFSAFAAGNRVLRLAVGQYECISNSTCGADEYCDIDSHTCKSFPTCPVCEVCPECPTCEICPECPDGWYLHNSQCMECPVGFHSLNNNCVECLTYRDCTNALKPYCSEENTCDPCPEGTAWKEPNCVPKFTVTIRDMTNTTTKTVLDGEYINELTPSVAELTFDYWTDEKGGSAISFPYQVKSDVTLYAYYKVEGTSSVTENYSIYGGNQSRTTAYTPSSSDFITYEFTLYRGNGCAGGWRGCGYGDVQYSLDGGAYTSITCYQNFVFYGKTMSIYRYITGIKNGDGCTTGTISYKPSHIEYPY